MVRSDLFEQVRVAPSGAICLKSVVCDGFEPGFHAAAFTHVHSDHISGSFETCMGQYHIYVSKITRDMLEAVTDDTYRGRTQLHTINYGEPAEITHDGKADYLTLFESKHMLGSSQVFLETHDNLRVLYSGDISPDDRPPKCDALVIDSTHGDPRFDRIIDSGSLERRMYDIVNGAISEKRPVCIHAHRGRLQHIMHRLSEPGVVRDSIPFLGGHVDLRMAQIYRKYGYGIRELKNRKSYEGDEIVCGGYPYVEFVASPNATPQEERGQAVTLNMIGGFGRATMGHKDGRHWIASDDHAEFSDILDYVREADPQMVVTDNYRGSYGMELAEQIKTRLGIPTKPLPVIRNV